VPALYVVALGVFFWTALPEGFVTLPSRGSLARPDIQLATGEQRSGAYSTDDLHSDGFIAAPVMLAGAVILAGASALAARRGAAATSSSVGSVVSIQALPKALEGTGGPFGDDVWDPAGLMNGRTEEQILWWRAVELKHCRVSMLAIVGWLHVSGGWHPIGDAAAGFRVSDDPLVNVTQTTMGGMWQLIFTLMVLEWVQTYPCPPPKDKPWDVLGWSAITPDEGEFSQQWKDKQLQELNNGRLAMFGILGLIGADAGSGDYAAWIHQPNFGQGNPYDWRGEPPFDMPPLFPLKDLATF